jgi:hypothetical protein
MIFEGIAILLFGIALLLYTEYSLFGILLSATSLLSFAVAYKKLRK